MNRLRIAAAGCSIAVLLAGCSENAGETVVPDQATPQAGEGSIAIEARDFSFVPDRVEANTSSVTIEVTNEGAEQHSLTVYASDEYQEPVDGAVVQAIAPGESASITFDAGSATTLNFRCEIHPDLMDGEISVGGTATTPASPTEAPRSGDATTTTTQEN